MIWNFLLYQVPLRAMRRGLLPGVLLQGGHGSQYPPGPYTEADGSRHCAASASADGAGEEGAQAQSATASPGIPWLGVVSVTALLSLCHKKSWLSKHRLLV